MTTGDQRKQELCWFILVSFGWSWILWTPVFLSTYGFVDFNLPYPRNWFYDFAYGNTITLSHMLTIIGGFGPLVGAAVVTWKFRDQAAVADLWRRVFDVRRIAPRWFLVALLMIPAINGLSICLASSLNGTPMAFGTGPLAADTLVGVLMLFFHSVAMMAILIVCEEMGWRGFMLPRLQTDRSALLWPAPYR